MSITKELFGTLKNGENVYQYTLDNKKGIQAVILTYGGIIKNLFVNGIDVVLGRDSLDEYLDNDGYLGAAIGRHANRIENSTFTINETVYNVGANENGNSLHGGFLGFDKKNWSAAESGSENEPALVLSATSPDGEEGFPGTLNVKITYMLNEKNGLSIHYEATSDKDTVVNLTNHSYFNLNGHNSGTIDKHVMQLNCGFYTPNTDKCSPYGEILSVSGTPFDFRAPKPIGQDINSDFEQIQMFGGYDHNFAINGVGFRKAAILSGDISGITMEVLTNKPAVQIYTSNALDTERKYKNNSCYNVHQAICLETQFFPNSTTFSHYPSAFLSKNEKYDYITEYRFNF